MRPPAENKTPVVARELIQPLLAAALYMTATIGPRIVLLPPLVQQRRREDAQLSETAADPAASSRSCAATLTPASPWKQSGTSTPGPA